MSAEPVIPCILPNEFTFFAALLGDDEHFPKTYASWLQLTYRGDARTRGTSVDVHSREFADYCRRQEKQPCIAVLREFAAVKFNC